MKFEAFEDEAHRMWAEIPAEYKEGIDGIVVKREAQAHPDHEDYYTLGMCFTEPYPSSYMGPDSTRSILALYHGSFERIAADDPDFPWREELWETITHELRHHLEFLAENDDLGGLDYALEQSYKREQGEAFDPWYYQAGLRLATGVYRVEYDVYIEQGWREQDLEDRERVEFAWDGKRWAVPMPEDLGDLHFVRVNDLDTGGGWLHLVLVRERPLRQRIARLFRRDRAEFHESEATPTEVGDAPGSPGPDDGRPGGGAGGPPSAAEESDDAS